MDRVFMEHLGTWIEMGTHTGFRGFWFNIQGSEGSGLTYRVQRVLV